MADHGSKWEEIGGGADGRRGYCMSLGEIKYQTRQSEKEQDGRGWDASSEETWLGHVARMNKKRRAKQVMKEGGREEKRQHRGRIDRKPPAKTCEDSEKPMFLRKGF